MLGHSGLKYLASERLLTGRCRRMIVPNFEYPFACVPRPPHRTVGTIPSPYDGDPQHRYHIFNPSSNPILSVTKAQRRYSLRFVTIHLTSVFVRLIIHRPLLYLGY